MMKASLPIPYGYNTELFIIFLFIFFLKKKSVNFRYNKKEIIRYLISSYVERD